MIPFEARGPIETARLLLRPFEAGDFDALFAIRSREDVTRYLYFGPQNESEVRAALETKMGCRVIRADGDALVFAAVLRWTNEVIGDVMLRVPSLAHRQGEIGYMFHPDHHGHGYATEAMQPLLRMAFEDLKLHRLFGLTEARNVASQRVLERLGMRREAHLVENEFVRGEWQSEVVYAILDREWRAR